jgi:hypothetical protein
LKGVGFLRPFSEENLLVQSIANRTQIAGTALRKSSVRRHPIENITNEKFKDVRSHSTAEARGISRSRLLNPYLFRGEKQKQRAVRAVFTPLHRVRCHMFLFLCQYTLKAS